nr:MAG TPA: hypothetical protein [Caudoviricetes sp.]
MHHIEIISGDPINHEVLAKIEKILTESICPYESLRESIPEFVSYDESRGIIQLSEGNTYKETIYTVGVI